MIKSHQSSLLRRLFFPNREVQTLKISPNNLLEKAKINKNKKSLKKRHN